MLKRLSRLYSPAKITVPKIEIGSKNVECVVNVKLLEMFIDNNLNYYVHSKQVTLKLSTSIGILHRLSAFLPRDILKTIYTALILPHQAYVVEVWFDAYSNATDRIFVLQKKLINCTNTLPYY